MCCVLLDLNGGAGEVRNDQFVPIEAQSAEQWRRVGYDIYTGLFTTQTERHGPYGSHLRDVATPCGPLTQS